MGKETSLICKTSEETLSIKYILEPLQYSNNFININIPYIMDALFGPDSDFNI